MIVLTFSLLNKDSRKKFFKKNFLLADVKLDIMFGIPFLIISNVEVDFQVQNLQWRSYIIEGVLPTTKQVKLIEKKEFAVVTLDPEHKAFIVHIAVLNVDLVDEVHPLKRPR